jgi:hypothetical protein
MAFPPFTLGRISGMLAQTVKEPLERQQAGASGAADLDGLEHHAPNALRGPSVHRRRVRGSTSASAREVGQLAERRKAYELFIPDIDHGSRSCVSHREEQRCTSNRESLQKSQYLLISRKRSQQPTRRI